MDTKWIPKIKNGYQMTTLLCSHMVSKIHDIGSHMVAKTQSVQWAFWILLIEK